MLYILKHTLAQSSLLSSISWYAVNLLLPISVYPVFPEPFVEKTLLFPIEWAWQTCQKSLDHECEGLLLAIHFILLIYMSVFLKHVFIFQLWLTFNIY